MPSLFSDSPAHMGGKRDISILKLCVIVPHTTMNYKEAAGRKL
ncbi:hypothetical protein BACCAP_01421 [Pseudoflavonifractor capillosus ATCC 29799]|uniref:Uncharacterized protein n=1 Tax=Pseudoflavonifractor capillosus ATCC 29799 TaxID=411467 RepID=A6NT91_9FIRM|nr:hypothetical protein BACCAP_01421 [Pseudoflavonifractor capillosus ATCC 29799]